MEIKIDTLELNKQMLILGALAFHNTKPTMQERETLEGLWHLCNNILNQAERLQPVAVKEAHHVN